jgi:predicted dehydrogenase
MRVGFVGAGMIARCHAFAMNALPYYYENAPEIVPAVVTSARPERAQAFARRFGFAAAVPEADFWASREVDTVFVLGPNRLHFEHARRALALPSLKRLYLEKPVCVTRDEARAMAEWTQAAPHVRIRVGFQILHMASLRHAWQEWRTGRFGAPLHFRLSLLHSGYLDRDYRATRASRLSPAPEGGALVDLGSHLVSMVLAFLGPRVEAVDAHALTPFADVDPRSDMHTLVVLRDAASGAVGTITASRIAAGHEDSLEVEFSGTDGGLRVRSGMPDVLEICTTPSRQDWQAVRCASDYAESSRFPSRAASAGWLRPLVHQHHLFFGPAEAEAEAGGFVPDLAHGLAVQKVLHDVVDMADFPCNDRKLDTSKVHRRKSR